MRPKRYPYYGNKKQPHEEIAELKKQIAVNKSMINHLEREMEKNLAWTYLSPALSQQHYYTSWHYHLSARELKKAHTEEERNRGWYTWKSM